MPSTELAIGALPPIGVPPTDAASPKSTRKARPLLARREHIAKQADQLAALVLPKLPGGATPRLPTPSDQSMTPEYPDPTKKSHARKRPANHIPRPRNAFILFRCDFVRDQTIPRSIERDHRNLSRIAGMMWTSMGPEQREPWVAMARKEKQAHADRFPNYRYKPEGLALPKRKVKVRGVGGEAYEEEEALGPDDDDYVDRRAPRRSERKDRGRELEKKEVAPAVSGPELPAHATLSYTLPHRRSSSCPPPGSQLSMSSLSGLHHHPNPFTSTGDMPPVRLDSVAPPRASSTRKDSGGMTQDDITTSRRPSRVLTFHSVQPVGSVFDGHGLANPFTFNSPDPGYSPTSTDGENWDNGLTYPWGNNGSGNTNGNGYILPTWTTSFGFPATQSSSAGGQMEWVSPAYSENAGYSLQSGYTWDTAGMTPKVIFKVCIPALWTYTVHRQ